nr:hypothetical protein Iba_chr07dCG10290 [Ipomoea batatas]
MPFSSSNTSLGLASPKGFTFGFAITGSSTIPCNADPSDRPDCELPGLLDCALVGLLVPTFTSFSISIFFQSKPFSASTSSRGLAAPNGLGLFTFTLSPPCLESLNPEPKVEDLAGGEAMGTGFFEAPQLSSPSALDAPPPPPSAPSGGLIEIRSPRWWALPLFIIESPTILPPIGAPGSLAIEVSISDPTRWRAHRPSPIIREPSAQTSLLHFLGGPLLGTRREPEHLFRRQAASGAVAMA